MRQKPVRAQKAVDAVAMLRKATVLTHHWRVMVG